MRKILIILIGVLHLVACSANELSQEDRNMINAVKNNELKTVQSLLDEGNSVETRDAKKRTLLMIATYDNNWEMALLLVKAGANVNAQDDMKNSPFLYAGAEGMLDLVKLYLVHGADFTVFNRYGGSALIPAAEKRHIEVVKLLVNTEGYPIDHVNNLGWTALMEAIVLGKQSSIQTDIVRVLVEGGCDINIPDGDGVSALSHARSRKYADIVAILEAASK